MSLLDQEVFHADALSCFLTVYDPCPPEGALVDPFPERAAAIARRLVGEPYGAPLQLHVDMILPRPASHYGPRGNVAPSSPRRHSVRPSLEELCGPLVQGLTGVLWRRPAQLTSVTFKKEYGDPPRARIKLFVRP